MISLLKNFNGKKGLLPDTLVLRDLVDFMAYTFRAKVTGISDRTNKSIKF